MQTFKFNDNDYIECEYKNTRNGFKHTATLYINGNAIESVKCNYLNRTWEAYEYQSVLYKLVDKSKVLSDSQKASLNDLIKNQWSKDDPAMKNLKMLSGLMAMGNLMFGGNESAQNDFKTRILKAGLPHGALEMPDDWSELDESEKTKRLDGVIKIFSEGK